MAEPLSFISKWKVKEGTLEGLIGYYKEILKIVEANEPQLIAFHGFVNEDGTETTSIQIHPDSASQEFHMQVLRDTWDAERDTTGEQHVLGPRLGEGRVDLEPEAGE